MYRKDSPPPFAIRFRRGGTPGGEAASGGEAAPGGKDAPAQGGAVEQGESDAAGAGEPADRLYQQALELTAIVAALADNLEVARFHVRDRLDRDATALALLCRRAAAERAPAERRRAYRDAKPHAQSCDALLDIIGLRLRRAGRDARSTDDAKALLGDIVAALDLLTAR
jgi:hypothetical protein